jgi:hypothetical protein
MRELLTRAGAIEGRALKRRLIPALESRKKITELSCAVAGLVATKKESEASLEFVKRAVKSEPPTSKEPPPYTIHPHHTAIEALCRPSKNHLLP